jgi:hypothetical protein
MSAVKDDAAIRIKGLVMEIDHLAAMLAFCGVASHNEDGAVGAFETAARAARSIAADLDAVKLPA